MIGCLGAVMSVLCCFCVAKQEQRDIRRLERLREPLLNPSSSDRVVPLSNQAVLAMTEPNSSIVLDISEPEHWRELLQPNLIVQWVQSLFDPISPTFYQTVFACDAIAPPLVFANTLMGIMKRLPTDETLLVVAMIYVSRLHKEGYSIGENNWRHMLLAGLLAASVQVERRGLLHESIISQMGLHAPRLGELEGAIRHLLKYKLEVSAEEASELFNVLTVFANTQTQPQ